jgi:thymidylate kinase
MVESQPVASPKASRRGAFVVLVGPDGVGKTSVARALVDMYDGTTGYFHFRPPFWSSLPARPEDVAPVPRSKPEIDGSKLLGWCRIIWSLVAFWGGFLARVRPAVRSGRLVVGDRWGYGYYAQPHGLKFYGPRWLGDRVTRALPTPDLVVNLTAAPEVIASRKQELTAPQLAAELALWRALPVRKLVSVDASTDAETAARVIFGLVNT